jgi:Uma2 family endonuclease
MTLQIEPLPQSRSPVRMSEQEYVRLYPESKDTEWCAGEVVIKMPIQDIHDILQRVIASTLEILVTKKRLGKVRGPSFTMRLPEKPSRRDPDILFIASDNPSTYSPTLLDGPADLIVEIISPESVDRDYIVKFQEYEAGGVREYWIIDPKNLSVVAYVRNAETKRFEPIPADDAGVRRSKTIDGFWLSSKLIYTDPPPTALDLLIAMDLLPKS